MIRAIALLLASATAAHGAEMIQVFCPPTKDLENRLQSDHWSEHKTWEGVTGDSIAQLWLSEQGTWSFTLKLIDGRTCLFASGDRWQSTKPPLPKGEEPS